MQSVKYKANGEASDYMLAVKGIYAMSPELGLNQTTDCFMINDPFLLQEMLEQNFEWILFACNTVR